MDICVLVKPVPDPASAAERLLEDGRLDRTCAPVVINGNDEYALEAALRIVDRHGGSVSVLSVTSVAGTEAVRRALAMGATSAVLVADDALEGSDALATMRVIARALGAVPFDLVFAGVSTSDSGMGTVHAGVAALRGIPFLGAASEIEVDGAARRVRVRRLTSSGSELLEAPLPALVSCTQAVGEPRYPSLKAIMAARSKPITVRSVADLGMLSTEVGMLATTNAVVGATESPQRSASRVIEGPVDDVASEVIAFLRQRRVI